MARARAGPAPAPVTLPLVETTCGVIVGTSPLPEALATGTETEILRVGAGALPVMLPLVEMTWGVMVGTSPLPEAVATVTGTKTASTGEAALPVPEAVGGAIIVAPSAGIVGMSPSPVPSATGTW